MGLLAAPGIDILSPSFLLGNVAQNCKGKIMPMPGAAHNPMHWHTLPLLVWAMWPRKVKENYANAWGRMQPHALAYFAPTVLGHMAQKRKGKSCQCMGLPHALAYFSPTVLGHIGVWFDSQGQHCSLYLNT